MKRPNGITIIGIMYLISAFSLLFFIVIPYAFALVIIPFFINFFLGKLILDGDPLGRKLTLILAPLQLIILHLYLIIHLLPPSIRYKLSLIIGGPWLALIMLPAGPIPFGIGIIILSMINWLNYKLYEYLIFNPIIWVTPVSITTIMYIIGIIYYLTKHEIKIFFSKTIMKPEVRKIITFKDIFNQISSNDELKNLYNNLLEIYKTKYPHNPDGVLKYHIWREVAKGCKIDLILKNLIQKNG